MNLTKEQVRAFSDPHEPKTLAMLPYPGWATRTWVDENDVTQRQLVISGPPCPIPRDELVVGPAPDDCVIPLTEEQFALVIAFWKKHRPPNYGVRP